MLQNQCLAQKKKNPDTINLRKRVKYKGVQVTYLPWAIKTDPDNIDAKTADLYLNHAIRHMMLTITDNQK